jgi:acyl CoA:acetate/3-ketoacid CoA transferase beta subunit
MSDHNIEEMLVCRIASEIDESGVTVLGSFTPLAYAAYMLAKLTHAPEAWLIAFNAIGVLPLTLDLAGVESACYRGAVARWSFIETTMTVHLGRRGLVECVSPAQLDGSGAFNLSVIGDYARPKVRLPGGAGSPEVVQNYGRIIFYFGRHDQRTLVEKVDFRTGGRMPIRAAERTALGLLPGSIRIITPLCVMVKDEDHTPFRLETLTAGVSVQDVIDNTGFDIEVPDLIETTPAPTAHQLALLRERIDPYGTIRFDSLDARQRRAYLRELLTDEWARAGGASGWASEQA